MADPGPQGPVRFVVPGRAGDDQDDVRFVKPERPPATSGNGTDGWPGWLGPLAVFVAYAAVFAAAAVALVVATPANTDTFLDDNKHWFALVQDVLWVGVALVLPFLAMRYLRPRQLGLNGARPLRAIGVGVGMMVAFYALSALYVQLAGLSSDDNQLLNELGFGSDVGTDLALALVYTVGAPVAEELLFRGVLFGSLRASLRRRFGPRAGVGAAVVVSGVVFGSVHAGGGQDQFLPMLMVLGMLLALAYQWSGTLYVPIVMHAWNNSVATGVQQSADGTTAILNQDVSEPWIAYVILAGPVLSLLAALLIAGLVRAVFPSVPRRLARDHPGDL